MITVLQRLALLATSIAALPVARLPAIEFIVPPNDPGGLDRALRMAREPGDRIVARDGRYYTAGNWAFQGYKSLASGVSLDVTGSIIQFIVNPATAPGGRTRPNKDLNILWAGANTVIKGGTWVCTPPLEGWYGGGMRFFGQYQISDAEIVGLRGTYADAVPAKQVEVFAISSEGDTGGSRITNVRVHDCTANAYVSGIYLGGTVSTLKPSFVTDCEVDLGYENQFAFSASYDTRFVNVRGRGGRYGFYTDTGQCVASLRKSQIIASYAAISFVGTSPGVERRLFVEDCTLVAPRAVEWWDHTGNGMTGGVVVTSSAIDAQWTAAVSSKTGDLAFAGNTLAKPLKYSLGEGSRPPLLVP